MTFTSRKALLDAAGPFLRANTELPGVLAAASQRGVWEEI